MSRTTFVVLLAAVAALAAADHTLRPRKGPPSPPGSGERSPGSVARRELLGPRHPGPVGW